MKETVARCSRRLARVTGAAILLSLTVVAGAAGATPEARPAPEFELEDINPDSPSHGKRLGLPELYTERGVVLNFVASWCGPCWAELPELEELVERDGLPLVYIAADEYGPTSDLLRLSAVAGASVPILHVPKEGIDEMSRRYNHAMLPATYVVNSKGSITRIYQGQLDSESLAELKEQFDPPASPR